MKKIIAFVLSLEMCFALISCKGLFTPTQSVEDGSVETESSEGVSTATESSEGVSTATESSEEGSVETESSESDSAETESSESDVQDSSDPETEYVTVTFKQEGQADVVKTLRKGDTLTDVPTPSAKTGYIVDRENWYADEARTVVANFTALQENATVYAKATAKTYVITLDANGGTLAETTVTVTYDQAYALTVPLHSEDIFLGWTFNGTKVALHGIWKLDADGTELTLTADWDRGNWTGYY